MISAVVHDLLLLTVHQSLLKCPANSFTDQLDSACASPLLCEDTVADLLDLDQNADPTANSPRSRQQRHAIGYRHAAQLLQQIHSKPSADEALSLLQATSF